MSFDEPCKTCGARIDGVDIAGGFIGDHCYCVPCLIEWINRLRKELEKLQELQYDH